MHHKPYGAIMWSSTAYKVRDWLKTVYPMAIVSLRG